MRTLSAIAMLILTGCGSFDAPIDRAGERGKEVIDVASARGAALIDHAAEKAHGLLTAAVEAGGAKAAALVTQAGGEARLSAQEATERLRTVGTELVAKLSAEVHRWLQDVGDRLQASVNLLGDRTIAAEDHATERIREMLAEAGGRVEKLADRIDASVNRAATKATDTAKETRAQARGLMDDVLQWLKDFWLWVLSAAGVGWTYWERLKRLRAEKTADILVQATDHEDADSVRGQAEKLLKGRRDEYRVREDIKRRRERIKGKA